MLELESKEEVRPICPHCEKELDRLWMNELRFALRRRQVYFCPHCRKVLGISYRRRVWMG